MHCGSIVPTHFLNTPYEYTYLTTQQFSNHYVCINILQGLCVNFLELNERTILVPKDTSAWKAPPLVSPLVGILI